MSKDKTKIEWTHMAGYVGATWNFIIGCLRKSAGCENCYAERQVHRGLSKQQKGLTKLTKKGPVWNGKFNVAEHRLDEPIRRTKPTMYFVNSLSDLFFEPVPFELIAASFGVMAAAQRHIFQILTKRPERANEFFGWLEDQAHEVRGHHPQWALDDCRLYVVLDAARKRKLIDVADRAAILHSGLAWPLKNVWLGVSVEDQETADRRVPMLRRLPAEVHWVSQEPQLGPVTYRPDTFEWKPLSPGPDDDGKLLPPIRWIVIGGESGPGARPFDLQWARQTIKETEGSMCSVFVKQLGAKAVDSNTGGNSAMRQAGWQPTTEAVELEHRKGGEITEWPEDLRVRDWPRVA
jgi:protein gp37